MKWRRLNDLGPSELCLNLRKNLVKKEDKSLFDEELDKWIAEGILIEHSPGQHGSVKNVMPLIGVRQVKGDSVKVRPIPDFRRLNELIESHPGGAMPLCTDRLREWRVKRHRCAVLDLKKAYLQIRVVPEKWAYQAVN